MEYPQRLVWGVLIRAIKDIQSGYDDPECMPAKQFLLSPEAKALAFEVGVPISLLTESVLDKLVGKARRKTVSHLITEIR